MADAAFDFLGEAGVHSAAEATESRSKTGALKEEEDAFAAAVSAWRGTSSH